MAFLARAVTSGPCEVEVNFGGEADLHQHEKGCEKNPGHVRFIPVDEFTVDHPDYDFDDSHLLDLVRAVIDLTVRVSVKYVSEERPETIFGTDIPFPCYSYRGSNRVRMLGTGWVCDVQIFTDCTNDNSCQLQERQNSQPTKPCPCPECQNSPAPKTQYAFIYIRTSAHVVFDDTEAEHTTCHLFYDRGRTPDSCDGAVALKGMSVLWSAGARDVCEMRHVTHDLDLAAKLKTMVSHLEEFGESVYKFDRLESKKDKSASLVSDEKTIIVSHPHGCSKQVSVGRYMGRDDFNGTSKLNSLSPIKYDTATCTGSSGAFLIVVKEGRFFYWGNNLVHNGICVENEDMNRSCRFFV